LRANRRLKLTRAAILVFPSFKRLGSGPGRLASAFGRRRGSMALNPDLVSPILRRLAGALIASIPVEWSEAKLRVEVDRSAEGTSIAHAIQSERHSPGVAVGTEELFVATRELQLLCDEAGEPWLALVVQVEQVEGQWRFSAKFEYAS
jgi:hypothetical protein